MAPFNERRKYQRCRSIPCKVLLSGDRIRWEQVEVQDLSATGLSMKTASQLNPSDRVFLNLYVYSMLSEFNISVEAAITRVVKDRSGYICGVAFRNISKAQQVQLDEVISRSGNLIEDNDSAMKDDEIFAFILYKQNKNDIKESKV